MRGPDDTALSALDQLVEICRDGEHGFRAAADRVRDPGLKDLFARWSQQRAKFTAALEAKIRRLGGNPRRGGSVAGALHRGWMTVRSTVSDDRTALAEAERGERAAIAAYEEALRQGLPTTARGLVEQQFTLIRDAFSSVRGLGEQAA